MVLNANDDTKVSSLPNHSSYVINKNLQIASLKVNVQNIQPENRLVLHILDLGSSPAPDSLPYSG